MECIKCRSYSQVLSKWAVCGKSAACLLLSSDPAKIQIVRTVETPVCNLYFWLFSVPPETYFISNRWHFCRYYSLGVMSLSPVWDGFSLLSLWAVRLSSTSLLQHTPSKTLGCHSILTEINNHAFCMQKYRYWRVLTWSSIHPLAVINWLKKSNYCQDILILILCFSWAKNIIFSITYLRFVSEFITIFCKSIAGNTSVCTLSLGLYLHLLYRMCWSENVILES